MFSPGFGAFGVESTTFNTIIGGAVGGDGSNGDAANYAAAAATSAAQAASSATDAANSATDAADSAGAAAGSAAASAGAAAASAGAAAASAAAAFASSIAGTVTTATNAAASAGSSATNGLVSAGAAALSASAAGAAKEGAETARDEAVLARDEAVIARDEAVAAANSVVENSESTWYQSPDYQLDTHPDDFTILRWAHLQSDPVAVQMFVRVRDPAFGRVSYGERIYPYSNLRVQPRYVAMNDKAFDRYLRIYQEPRKPMFFKNVRVKVRRAQVADSFQLSLQDKLVQSSNIANIQNVIFASEDGIDMAVGTNDSLPKMMEFDLGENIRVETLIITSFQDNGQNNHGMNVKLLADTRPTIDLLIPATDPSVNFNHERFMDPADEERTRTFSSSNDIEVIFDNADMIKLMKVDRSDRNLLSDPNSARTLFLRAQFSAITPAVLGTVKQKTPSNENIVFDFVY
jgi:hypothetical protein